MAVDTITLAKATEKGAGIATGNGLTADEVHLRLEKFGPNAMPDTASHPLRRLVEKFWAPVPWMIEAAVLLQMVLGKYVEASIIADRVKAPVFARLRG